MTDHSAEQLACMEVWGGNQTAESGVVMAGLDAWVYCAPYRGAARGGDVYYLSSCATGRINRLLVADVSGHGDQVSSTAAELRLLMRRYVNHISQGKFIARMNSQFAQLADSGGFATAAVATFYAPTNELLFSSAGHPPPLWYQSNLRRWCLLDERQLTRSLATQRGRSEELRQGMAAGEDESASDTPANLPLGLLDDSRYSEHCLALRTGDLVLFYTDSLIECMGSDGQLLGAQRLLELVSQLDPVDPQPFISRLLEQLAALHPDNLTEDDVTALLIRPNGLAPRVPWKQSILAPLRLMRGLVSSLVRGGRDAPWPEFSRRNLGVNPYQRLGGELEGD
ncbi:MAG: PP2C family protein-serine/threonine phosphatase [Pirellulales bacterium]